MKPEHKEIMKARKRNIRLTVSYDGTAYNGFQRQNPPQIAVQNVLEEKLQQVWLCHLSEENNTPYMAIETVQNHIKGAGRFQEGKPEVQALNRRLPTGAFCLDMGEEE